MPLFLVGLCGLLVAPLVVAKDLAQMPPLGNLPTTTQQRRAALVQRPAHLLRRHTRIFPPATARSAWPPSPTPPAPRSGAVSAPCRPAPRSASGRPPACPGGSRAPPPSGKRPRPTAAPAGQTWHCSGSTSPPPSPR